jgi:hypothetical protein
MDAAEIQAWSLIPGEVENREIERAVAEEDAVRLALALLLDPPDLREVEGRFVELGCGERITRGNRDVAKLGHRFLQILSQQA